MLAYSLAFASSVYTFCLVPRVAEGACPVGGWLNSVKVTLGLAGTGARAEVLQHRRPDLSLGLLDREDQHRNMDRHFFIPRSSRTGNARMKSDTPVECVTVPITCLSHVFICGLLLFPASEVAPPKALADLPASDAPHDFDLLRSRAHCMRNNTICDDPKYADFLPAAWTQRLLRLCQALACRVSRTNRCSIIHRTRLHELP